MNWQSLDVRPFDPATHHLAAQERRRRLFGSPTAKRAQERVEAAIEPLLLVQHDDHVRAWEHFQRHMPVGRYSRYVYTRCIELGANYIDVVGPARHRELIYTRHLLMWELRNRFDPAPSFTEIGVIFKRDHTSVLYAVHRWDEANATRS